MTDSDAVFNDAVEKADGVDDLIRRLGDGWQVMLTLQHVDRHGYTDVQSLVGVKVGPAGTEFEVHFVDV